MTNPARALHPPPRAAIPTRTCPRVLPARARASVPPAQFGATPWHPRCRWGHEAPLVCSYGARLRNLETSHGIHGLELLLNEGNVRVRNPEDRASAVLRIHGGHNVRVNLGAENTIEGNGFRGAAVNRDLFGHGSIVYRYSQGVNGAGFAGLRGGA